MKNKILSLLLCCIIATPALADTVSVTNDDSCEIIGYAPNIKVEKVPPVTVFSFYYDSNGNRHLDQTLASGDTKNIAMSIAKSISPDTPLAELSYSPDPNYLFNLSHNSVPTNVHYHITLFATNPSPGICQLVCTTMNPCLNLVTDDVYNKYCQ